MTETVRNHEALTVFAAEHSGYYVMQAETPDSRGLFRNVLFAGTLDECLLWLKGHIRL